MENDDVSPVVIEASKTWLRRYDWGPWMIDILERSALPDWLRAVSSLHRTLEGQLPQWTAA